MNTKKLFLFFLTVLFVGVMNADEVVSVENNETRNIELIKEDCRQLLTLQAKARNTDLGKEFNTQLQLGGQLGASLILEYNQCELAGICDNLADVFDEYKKTFDRIKVLTEAYNETDEFKKITEILKK